MTVIEPGGHEAHDIEGEGNTYYPETQVLIDSLLANPVQGFGCSLDGSPAVGVYEVPGGCVALPGLETQTLCPQHVLTDGSFDGMHCVVDLSVNAAWSIYRKQEPDYCMFKDTDTGEISMLEFKSSPFVGEV